MKPKVLALCPNPNDATSFYRGVFPFSKISDLTVIAGPMGWSKIATADVVVVQRPHSEKHLQFCRLVKLMGKPLWVDYDDNFLKVPRSSPAYAVYKAPAVAQNIFGMLGIADVVTASTGPLAEVLKGLNPAIEGNVKRIPNSIPKGLPDISMLAKQQKTVVWRGSPTHTQDVQEQCGPINELIEEYPSWNWVFMAYHPWHIPVRENVRFVDATPVPVYFQQIMDMKPSIFMVPLHDSNFNRCKSNIAWLEATRVGAVCVAPKFEEWDYKGVLHYRKPGDFKARMKEALEMKQSERRALVEQSERSIQDHFSPDMTDDQRADILRLLVENNLS